MEAIFEIQNLTFRYPAGKKNALENISFTVEAGQFLLLFGASASGKSTLLRHLKFLTAPFGERTGKILYKGEELSSVPSQRLVSEIGFVFQNPDTQMFCERVFDELAFGLSQIGLERSEIMRRVGETAAFFGIANLLDRSVDTLSGGQKQLVNLASVTVLRPSVILLDEPTAMLDPVAAANFYAMLYRLNREQGITVILCEHRCEEALLLSDSVLFMEEGRAAVRGPMQQVLKDMWEDPARRRYLPVPLQVLRQQGMLSDGDWPLRVSSLRELFARCKGLSPKAPSTAPLSKKEKTLEAKGLCFRYEKKMPDILRDVSFACHKGEIFALVGGNGSGKTTLLKVLAGILRADCGKVKKEKNAVYLPQNVGLLFLKDTLEADFRFQLSMDGAPETVLYQAERTYPTLFSEFLSLRDRNPLDLSGGELQRMAFLKVLLKQPEILLLDEPVKGLDVFCRRELGEILQGLAKEGKTVLLATHDMEFIADWADRAAMLFDGKITGSDTADAFLMQNQFYTTQLSRVMPETLRKIVGIKYLDTGERPDEMET